jgi:putative transposase
MAKEQSYPTIWKVSDNFWEIIKTLLEEFDPPASTGRPRHDRRPIFNAIIHRLRTGCQWNQLPKEFGDDSKIHRVFQHWVKLDFFVHIPDDRERPFRAIGSPQSLVKGFCEC